MPAEDNLLGGGNKHEAWVFAMNAKVPLGGGGALGSGCAGGPGG